MTKKHFLNEILSPKLLVGAWGFILVICVFIGFSIRGKCATVANGSLPYNVPQYRNANSVITDDVIEIALQRAIADARWLGYQGDLNYLVFTVDGIVNGSNYDIWFIPNPSIEQNVLSDYNFLDGTIRVTANGLQLQRVMVDINTGSVSGGFVNLGTYADLLGDSSTGSLNGGNFTPRYPFKMIGIAEIKSANDVVVFTNTVAPVSPTGHATPPDLIGDNIDNDKPDIDDYLPTLPNMPSIDNSSLEKIAESIFNILQWGFNAIKGTITGLFEYLGDLLSYSFQKVIDNIKNAIKNLYDNFESLFSPLLNGISDLLVSISQKLDYISQPFDSEALQEAFENTAISGDIDSISQLNEQAFGTWSTTEEPNEFKIALHTEQIPLADNVNMTATTQYIDLGVINGAKPYIRGIMWCLLTFSLLYTIIDSIPNYIGGNDE